MGDDHDPIEALNVKDPNPSVVHVYLQILLSPKPLRPSDLADRSGYHRSTVQSALGTLIDAGVVKEADPQGDARETYYESVYVL